MTTHRHAFLALAIASALAGCYGPSADVGEARGALTGELAASPAGRFIERNGDAEGRLCRAAGRTTVCASADRRRPVSAAEPAVGGLVYDCALAADGSVTGCAPPAEPYHCMPNLCECYSMADCMHLAIERRCDVVIFDDHLGPITGVCRPGSAG